MKVVRYNKINGNSFSEKIYFHSIKPSISTRAFTNLNINPTQKGISLIQ